MSESTVNNTPVSAKETVSGVEDLVKEGKNSKTIRCQRCPSKILNCGVGTYEEREFMLPRMTVKAEGSAPEDADTLLQYWSVDDIYKFENMGFSNTVGQTKYLLCADCEIGPIGWFDLNTKISYVALQRVVHE